MRAPFEYTVAREVTAVWVKTLGICVSLALVCSCTSALEVPGHDGPRQYRTPSIDKRSDNPIILENALPGTNAWAIEQPSSSHEIEGYAGTTSAAAGDHVTVFVNVDAPAHFTWKLFRLGYYGGLGGRFITGSEAPLPIGPQTPCPVDGSTGMIECHWDNAFSLDVPTSWPTGQYLFKLTRDDGFESYVPLIVRETTRRAPMLYQSNVTTWQAYNAWGGASLYRNDLGDDQSFHDARAYRVSFDRPYQDAGDGHLLLWERWFLSWLEMKGYDVAYATNVDVDRSPDLLSGRRLFVESGHDEYWSQGERQAVEDARDHGVSLAFFSANDAYWRIRLDDSSEGEPRRIVTCYKDANLDPHRDSIDTTVEWRQKPFARAEDSLLGQMYELFTDVDGFPLVVSNADHWAYRGTGLVNGDALSHIVGSEWDHVFGDSGSPTELEIIAHSDAIGAYGSSAPANVTVYYPSESSFVFAGGTIQWPWGLGKPGYGDDRIQRITENVISQAGLEPLAPTLVEPRAMPDDVGDAAEVSVVAGTGVAGYADGPAAQAQFNDPSGVAVGPDGTIYVTEARNHRVRKITTDGIVSTLAGSGPTDVTTPFRMKDGPDAKATFDVPTGIAVGPDGVVYVSDAHSYAIRYISPQGRVHTYAGTGYQGHDDSPDPLKASFAYPRGLAFGPDGALYVADAYNSRIRRIDPDGVTTVGTATNRGSGVAVAADGTIYVLSDEQNGVGVIKDGVMVPIVNASGLGGDQPGLGITAMLRPADGLLVDGHMLVLSDTANYKVRRVSLTDEHTVSTLAGSGLGGQAVGTGQSTRLVNPRGIALSPHGYIVADSGNHRILRIVR